MRLERELLTDDLSFLNKSAYNGWPNYKALKFSIL